MDFTLVAIPLPTCQSPPGPAIAFRSASVVPLGAVHVESQWGVRTCSGMRRAVEKCEVEGGMIGIRHRETGALLLEIDADSLVGVQLSGEVVRGADLRGVDLRGVQLRRATLIDTDLRGANLVTARFNGADLTDVQLGGADLRGAHFTEAKVRGGDFHRADLSGTAWQNALLVNTVLDEATFAGANLRRSTLIGADLMAASLTEADLTGALMLSVRVTRANLSGACFAETFIADCRTLHEALGLTEIKFLAPSSLDVRTLRACAIHLPDVFLQGLGYTPEEVHSLKTLYAQPTP